MMSLFPWTRAFRAKKVAKDTDFGRRYGWYIERQGRRIGELNYIRWDSLAQFWHEYSVTWHDQTESCIASDADAWLKEIVLRNKHYTDVVVSGSFAAMRAKDVIAVRYASVPLERFQEDETV